MKTLTLVHGSQEAIEIEIEAHDGTGAEYDWTGDTVTVQAQRLGTDYKALAWESGAGMTSYTAANGKRWLRIEGLLATARATEGPYIVYYKIDTADVPVKRGCVLKVI
jgi:hypothetical protein